LINNLSEILKRRRELTIEFQELTKRFSELCIGSKLKIECNYNSKFSDIPKISVYDNENY
jgi:hypothetical protein